MEIQQLEYLIQTDLSKVKEALEIGRDIDIIKKAIDRYNPKKHDVHDILPQLKGVAAPVEDGNDNDKKMEDDLPF